MVNMALSLVVLSDIIGLIYYFLLLQSKEHIPNVVPIEVLFDVTGFLTSI